MGRKNGPRAPTRFSITPLKLQQEIEHILGEAAQDRATVVQHGRFVLFSNHTGDAWLLDALDKDALCLMKSYTRREISISETEKSVAVAWDGTFEIERTMFVTDAIDGELAGILGYPMELILAALTRARAASRR